MKNRINKCVVCSNKEITLLFAHHGRQMGRCRHCKLVQLVPMPSKTEIAKLYHEDFDHFAPYIDQLPVHRAYFKQKISDIIKAYPESEIMNNESWKNKIQKSSFIIHNSSFKLLDIGCAMGALLEEAQKQGIEAVGIDISRDAVAYCRNRGLHVHAGTLSSLARRGLARHRPKGLAHIGRPNAFNIITAFQVIEHEQDPLAFMRRIHKLLKKRGMVVLATPNHGGFWRKVMGRRWFGFSHPEHVVLLDFASMRFLLEKAGFADIEIRKDSPRPFPLSFALRRAADYFPAFRWILIPLGKLFDRFHILNPINPWNDMIMYARK